MWVRSGHLKRCYVSLWIIMTISFFLKWKYWNTLICVAFGGVNYDLFVSTIKSCRFIPIHNVEAHWDQEVGSFYDTLLRAVLCLSVLSSTFIQHFTCTVLSSTRVSWTAVWQHVRMSGGSFHSFSALVTVSFVSLQFIYRRWRHVWRI